MGAFHGRKLLIPLAGAVLTSACCFAYSSHLVYIASRKLEDLKKVAEKLNVTSPNKGSGPACIPVQADIGSKAGCDALAKYVKDNETELDILVNNSGLTWGAPMDDFPEDKGWDKTFHLNVKSQFYLTVA